VLGREACASPRDPATHRISHRETAFGEGGLERCAESLGAFLVQAFAEGGAPKVLPKRSAERLGASLVSSLLCRVPLPIYSASTCGASPKVLRRRCFAEGASPKVLRRRCFAEGASPKVLRRRCFAEGEAQDTVTESDCVLRRRTRRNKGYTSANERFQAPVAFAEDSPSALVLLKATLKKETLNFLQEKCLLRL